MELHVDHLRLDSFKEDYETAIFVRAVYPGGKVDNADIWLLDRKSFFVWLRSRGGDNLWAENVLMLVFGHEPVSGSDIEGLLE